MSDEQKKVYWDEWDKISKSMKEKEARGEQIERPMTPPDNKIYYTRIIANEKIDRSSEKI
jgi:hypothetical protein